MVFGIQDSLATMFRTTRTGDAICADLTRKLGWRNRYVAARLAVGRSLSIPEQPPTLSDRDSEDMATSMRGRQLFGDDDHAAAWMALITQHCDDAELTKRALQGLVARHWHRGALLLRRDWEACGEQMQGFVARLAELASFSGDGDRRDDASLTAATPTYAGEVRLPVGEIARDLFSDEEVTFSVNGAGGSPHMAIMGGVGSGKTRTAIHMLGTLRQSCELPLLAFDFKGDLTDDFKSSFGATPITPPTMAVPLDVLSISSNDETSVKTAAARIRDSIASVKDRRPSGIQSEALRVAVETVLRRRSPDAPANLSGVALALDAEYESRGRKADELSSTLKELTQFILFKPELSPAEFFARSWIIQLPQDGSAEMRRLIINLTLDALDRWINSLPDAPSDDNGTRSLRHLTMLDEAHVILSTRLPALGNLVRMSRSKGGSVMLISQSPDDFEGAEDGYLDNMGLTLAFNTQAKPGPTKRIFGGTSSLTGLQRGEALCRIRSEARTQKVQCWAPRT